MTLPPCRSWFPEGERLEIAYVAPQGRRVNAIGAHFTHGPEAGRFEHQSWASLPKSRSKKQRLSDEQRAAKHGLRADEVGAIDSERLVEFIWRIAGRAEGMEGWVRERELKVVLDNYSVHRSEVVEQAVPELARARIDLVYLPSYSPELSRIEPDWRDVKYHHLPKRSYETVAELKKAVDEGLARKAELLKQAQTKSTSFGQLDT